MTRVALASSAVFVAVAAVGVSLVLRSDPDPGPFADPPANATFATVGSGNYRIRYADSGAVSRDSSEEAATTTTTLVLVHGFAGCLETWSALTSRLMEDENNNFRVVALDLLGSGFSDKPIDGGGFEYTFRNLGGTVLTDFVRGMNSTAAAAEGDDGDVVLVGHSAGGIVAAAAAAALAEKDRPARGLFLVAPGFFQVKPAFLSYGPLHFLGRLLGRLARAQLPRLWDGHGVEGHVKDAFAASLRTPNATAALEQMVVAAEGPYVEVLSGIPAGTAVHIVWSERDTVNPPAAGAIDEYLQRLEHVTPEVTHTVLSDSGHYIQHDHPERLAQEITAFVAGLASRP